MFHVTPSNVFPLTERTVIEKCTYREIVVVVIVVLVAIVVGRVGLESRRGVLLLGHFLRKLVPCMTNGVVSDYYYAVLASMGEPLLSLELARSLRYPG